ncbi:hypothetical protein [uncultured Thiohalocapsa sp.]|uniref:hypothetical protein n=1 Tax=uncultured Thiohalocapsa sp. TaxID=768990 RepID=UPI0025CD7F0F|nr:hypothetical protein [uncultured Thiohalocapsa sp.]
MFDLMLLLTAAYITCYVLLGLLHLVPEHRLPLPEDHRHRLAGLLHLLIAIALLVKQLPTGH